MANKPQKWMSKTMLDLLTKTMQDKAGKLYEQAKGAMEDLFYEEDDTGTDWLTKMEEVGAHLDMDWQYTITGTPESGYSCLIFGAASVEGKGDNHEEALTDAQIQLGTLLTRQQKKGDKMAKPPKRVVHGRY